MEGVSEAKTLGKSILVPSVIQLAKGSNLLEVPDRFIRNDQDHPSSTTSDNLEDTIDQKVPVIDMECLASGDRVELNKLHLACQEWGFFQVINHGVSLSLVENFKKETQEFFNLPMEEKKKYWQTPTEVEGFGQAFVVSEEQKLDWTDMFYLTTLPKHQRKAHLLPMLPLPYRDTLENYSAELEKLAIKILVCMEKALQIDNELLRNVFEEGSQMIRMNYYPPCPQPAKVIGLTPHSDPVGLTILLQLNEIEGLQINKDEKWVGVKPLPNAFVVNIGDILEILSNGKYRSILHRAVVNATNERISAATFYSPSLDKEIDPIPSLSTTNSAPMFRRINMVDYWKGLFARPLERKSYLEHMRINKNDECLL